MRHEIFRRLCLIAVVWASSVLSGSPAGASTATSSRPPQTWEIYWRAHGVNPPPPAGFLEGGYTGKILNLTGGKLSDAQVRQWVLADLRRGRGDMWASYHLRLDVANAGVLGPRGLNGTDEFIAGEIARGVLRIEDHGMYERLTIAVIALSRQQRERDSSAALSEYVIVTMRRATGKTKERIFRDGHSEAIPSQLKPGDLRWQLDSGEFRDDPVVGPLWYQLRGWSCAPGDGTAAGEICALVKP